MNVDCYNIHCSFICKTEGKWSFFCDDVNKFTPHCITHLDRSDTFALFKGKENKKEKSCIKHKL